IFVPAADAKRAVEVLQTLSRRDN
ncbi:transporter, partial [Sinorhizobium meliloti]